MPRILQSLALLLVLLGCTTPLAGQRFVVEGASRHPATELLREIAERNDYLLLDRDTILGADIRIEQDLVVVDATVRLEGSVTGSVAVLGGTFFIRPGAAIGGVSVSAAGVIGTSHLATMSDTLFVPPEHRVAIERTADAYVVRVTPPRRPPLLRPEGFFGVLVPSYDRVNGATVRVGLGGGFGIDSLRPHYSVVGSYFSARGAVAAVGSLRIPGGSGASVVLTGGREVRTRDAWVRGDLLNSLSALFLRSDLRDYHESDFGAVRIEQTPPLLLDPGQGYFLPQLTIMASHDRSLSARNVWSLFGDDPWRENPEVFHGKLTSAIAGVRAGWQGGSSALRTTTEVEWAFPSPVGEDWGERNFIQATVDGRWTMTALWRHSIEIRARATQTFGPDAPPPQRWSILGGPGSLPTFEPGAMRGDNLAFVQSTYTIPLRGIKVPLLGMPNLLARHAIGSAWLSDGETPDWEQNLTGGFRFGLAEFLVSANPAEADLDPHFSAALVMPF